jgi:hypothetical protein
MRLVFHCAEVCPNSGSVGIFFHDTTAPECCQLDQIPFYGPFRGEYLGCTLRELASKDQV